MGSLDHIAVSAATVEEGAVHVAACLGQPPGPGGRHALMGTHNRLMGLGDGEYLEVITVDPEGAPPPHPRWFDIDRFTGQPRLTNWIVRVDDIEGAVATNPALGRILSLSRGDLRWRMAVPEDGSLPYDNCFPAVIQWDSAAPTFSDLGLRLTTLTVQHPDADGLRTTLAALIDDSRVSVTQGDPALIAQFDTPDGPRVLR